MYFERASKAEAYNNNSIEIPWYMTDTREDLISQTKFCF